MLPYGGTMLGQQPQPLIEAFEVLRRVDEEIDFRREVDLEVQLSDRLLNGLIGAFSGRA